MFLSHDGLVSTCNAHNNFDCSFLQGLVYPAELHITNIITVLFVATHCLLTLYSQFKIIHLFSPDISCYLASMAFKNLNKLILDVRSRWQQTNAFPILPLQTQNEKASYCSNGNSEN